MLLIKCPNDHQDNPGGSAGIRSPFPLRVPCRDMNLETSQMVFVGPYLAAVAREEFDRAGLQPVQRRAHGDARGPAGLRVPARQAGCGAAGAHAGGVREGEQGARARRRREPECLMDYWMQETVREME